MRVDRPAHLPQLMAFAALLLFAWVLYHWTTTFLTPRQQHQPVFHNAPVSSKVLAEMVVGLRLFGGGAVGNDALTPVPVAAPSSLGVLGIYAVRQGRSGFAVLVLDGKPLPAVVGQEFAPGMTLTRVHPDSVEIMRGGQLEIARMASAPISAPVAPTAAAKLSPASGLRMSVQKLAPGKFTFSSEEMMTALKQPDQTVWLGNYSPHPQGGAQLEQSPTGGLPDQLGLQVGDVITRLNGKRLIRPGDMARLYEQMVKSESVNMEVMRAGNKINVGIQVEK
jgi:type II secretory pathway component PulC